MPVGLTLSKSVPVVPSMTYKEPAYPIPSSRPSPQAPTTTRVPSAVMATADPYIIAWSGSAGTNLTSCSPCRKPNPRPQTRSAQGEGREGQGEEGPPKIQGPSFCSPSNLCVSQEESAFFIPPGRLAPAMFFFAVLPSFYCCSPRGAMGGWERRLELPLPWCGCMADAAAGVVALGGSTTPPLLPPLSVPGAALGCLDAKDSSCKGNQLEPLSGCCGAPLPILGSPTMAWMCQNATEWVGKCTSGRRLTFLLGVDYKPIRSALKTTDHESYTGELSQVSTRIHENKNIASESGTCAGASRPLRMGS